MTLAATNNGIDRAAVLRELGLDIARPAAQAVILICERYDLDPLLKHMVLIQQRPYITRDGYLHVAHRSKQFDGLDVVDTGETQSHWWAKVAVHRKDMGHPFTFVGRYPKSGSNKAYGPEMAIKCAEVAALRRAFDVTGVPALDEAWDVVDVSSEPPATGEQRALILEAMNAIDENDRGYVQDHLVDAFGPARDLRASQVDDVLTAIHIFGHRGAGPTPTGLAVSGGGNADGPESAPSGENAPGPSATPNIVEGRESGISTQPHEAPAVESAEPASVSSAVVGGEVEAQVSAGKGDSANRPPATSSPAPIDDAARIAMWCADAGIGDDLRPAFLHACVGVTSAHDVPPAVLGALRETLDEIRAGRLELVVYPDGGAAPWLREVGSTEVRQTDEPAPAEVTWRALLGQVRGIGQKKLLDQARLLAGEHGLDLPLSIDEIPSSLNSELRSWLDEQQAVRT